MSEQNDSTKVTVNKVNGVAYVEFASHAHNSLSLRGMHELTEVMHEQSNNLDTGIIVLKSGGKKTFCAGANFEELSSIKNQRTSEEFFNGFAQLFLAIFECKKIIIAQVQGKVVGGALGIICAADLSYATDRAEAKLSELNVGIGPFVVGPAIQNKIGLAHLNRMTYAPNSFFSVSWLHSIGFYTEIVTSHEDLEKQVNAKAEELLTYNPAALEQIKVATRPNVDKLRQLLNKRVKLSANLLLTEFAQKRLKELLKKVV